MPREARLAVESIQESRNPIISGMFIDDQAGRAVHDFIRGHHLHAFNEYILGRPAGLVVSGAPADLHEFIETFLSQDSERSVYSLVE